MAAAAALLGVCQAAQVVRIATVTFTNLPADGNTITINGSVRTFKTAVTSASTQVAIAANTNAMALAYATQLGTYPYTDVSVHQQGAVVFLAGKADGALSASMAGSWGTVSVATRTLTNYTTILPFSAYPVALRDDMGDLLVDALSVYPTTSIPANAVAMANFLDLTEAQTATGTKTFTRADIATLNMTAHGLFSGAFSLTNTSPIIHFADTDASANNKRTQIIADQAAFLVKFLNDAGSSSSNVFEITKDSTFGSSGARFRTRLTADYIYGTVITNSLLTNITGINSEYAELAYTVIGDLFSITNDTPQFVMWDTDAASGLRGWRWLHDDGILRLQLGNDSADFTGTTKEVMSFVRTGTDNTDVTVTIRSPVSILGGMSLSGADFLDGDPGFRTPGYFIVSDGTETLPDGFLGGLFLAPGSSPIVAPSGGMVAWNSGGELAYRNDGDTVDQRYHNRTATTQGVGTDYTLTASTAAVDFGTTDPNFTAPTSGTYLIFGQIAFTAAGTSAPDSFRWKLRNTTAGADITGADHELTNLAANELGDGSFMHTATLTASDVVALYAHNNTSARGLVNSARTRIGYVRLY